MTQADWVGQVEKIMFEADMDIGETERVGGLLKDFIRSLLSSRYTSPYK